MYVMKRAAIGFIRIQTATVATKLASFRVRVLSNARRHVRRVSARRGFRLSRNDLILSCATLLTYFFHTSLCIDFKMTTYIPSLTLPSVLFENAAVSILLPIAAGTAVGFSTQRRTNKTCIHVASSTCISLTSSLQLLVLDSNMPH